MRLQKRILRLLRDGINLAEIRRRTIIVLLFIGLLAFVDHMIVYTQAELGQQSQLVAEATFQQRTAMRLSRRLVETLPQLHGGELSMARKDLLSFADQILTTHNNLQDGISGKSWLSQENAKELNHFYNESPFLLDRRLRAYTERIQSLANAPASQLTLNNPDYLYMMNPQTSGDLFNAHDALMNFQQDNVNKQIDRLKTVNLVNFIITMLVLASTGLFIFRPMIQTIQTTLEQLQNSNRQLFMELSARQQAEKSLRASTRQKERTLTAITHDLRTPLRGECRILEQWLQGTFGPITSDQRDIVQTMLVSSRTLEQMLDNMVAAFDYEDKKMRLSPEWITLNDMLTTVFTKELNAFADDKQQTITLNLADNLPRLLGDPVEMKRVFTNLGHNAIKYSPNKSTITVSTELFQKPGDDSEPTVFVYIDDEGGGISDNMTQHLFQPFINLENKYRQIGMGLGLYLSKTIVEAHGGKISYSPHAKGTRFTVQLPPTFSGLGLIDRIDGDNLTAINALEAQLA